MEEYGLNIRNDSVDDKLFDVNMIDNCLIINETDSVDFEEILKNKEEFIKVKNNYVNLPFDIIKDKKFINESNKIWNHFDNIFDDIYNKVDYIRLNVNCDELEYINNHEVLKDKKIVLGDTIDITDYEKINELIEKYKDYPNIYVDLSDSNDYVTLSECEKIIDAIRLKAEYIKSLNLSPLESIMIAYDMVRDRVYTKEKGDNWKESRDLKSVLFGESIVCVGYSKIIYSILKYLDIEVERINLVNKKSDSRHERNGIYIDDPKYGVKGYYFLDATWDSKVKEDNNDYLYSYKFFMRSLDEIKEIEENRYSINNFIDDFNKLIKDVTNIYNGRNITESIIRLNGFSVKLKCLAKRVHYDYNVSIDVQKHIITGKLDLDYSLDYMIHIIKELEAEYSKNISAEVFLELVNNVRRIENYIDPVKYPYSNKDICLIGLNSDFTFDNEYVSEATKLLLSIFEPDDKEDQMYNINIHEYIKRMNIDESAKKTEFTKTLSRVLEKKQSE